MNRVLDRLIIVTGALALVFGICTWLVRDSKGNAHYYEGDNTVKLCEYIELQMLKTDTELIPYDGDRIRIQYRSIMPISVMLGDNRLIITESDELKLTLMTGDPEQFRLRLYLPKNIYKSIIVTAASGDVDIGRIDADAVAVTTKSGAITATETRSQMNLVSGTGDISLSFESVISGSAISTRSGNAQILFPRGSSVALAYETETGEFSSDLISGSVDGSFMYSFSGGANLIRAEVESGTLTVNEYDAEDEK